MTYSLYTSEKVLQTGFDWKLKLRFSSDAEALFPEEATFIAHVAWKGSDKPIFGLSTANGLIELLEDGNSIELTIPGEQTKDWPAGVVCLDVLRVDQSEPVHLGFDIEIPVVQSITRL